jgi:hypothetical protein
MDGIVAADYHDNLTTTGLVTYGQGKIISYKDAIKVERLVGHAPKTKGIRLKRRASFHRALGPSYAVGGQW